MAEWLYEFALHFGYLGVFIISLIGSASVLFPVPYTLVIYLLGGVLNPTFIAISGGIGSALGECSGYIIGRYGRKIISKDRQRKMEFMVKVFQRYGSVAIFLFALTPLPDDLLFIPLGILKYPFLRAFIPALAGKITMNFILAYGGRFSIKLIREFLGGEGWVGAVLTAILLFLIIVVMLRVDWEKVFERYFVKKE